MDQYYTGYLPQAASIVTDLNRQHTYTLPAGKTLCFPWKITNPWQLLVVDAANTTPFESAWIPGIRCWPSWEAAGSSFMSSPLQAQGHINLVPSGTRWLFHPLESDPTQWPEHDLSHWVYPGQTQWMNVQNLQNRDNYFYLRFTYHGNGVTLEL